MPYVLFYIFPSFPFLGLVIENILDEIFTSKLDKQFESIIKDEKDEEEEEEKELISVAVVDGKAYWVHENTFYEADLENNEINKETSRPINAFEMSSYDITKLLFILDNLTEGK